MPRKVFEDCEKKGKRTLFAREHAVQAHKVIHSHRVNANFRTEVKRSESDMNRIVSDFVPILFTCKYAVCARTRARVCVCVCVCVCEPCQRSLSLSLSLSLYFSIFLYFCLCVCVSLCLCVCVSLSISQHNSLNSENYPFKVDDGLSGQM